MENLMARSDGQTARFEVALGDYILGCTPDGLPPLFDEDSQRAGLVEKFALDEEDLCCLTVSRSGEPWPFLVVAQGFAPAGWGFEPGLLLIPEAKRLFVGAGERIIAYDLAVPRRLWLDSAYGGFYAWAQHGDVVVMSAELELAAWKVSGEKLWTTSVEPPWWYRVDCETLRLDVMGDVRQFPLLSGPR